MTDKQYNRKLEHIKKKQNDYEQRQALKSEREKYKPEIFKTKLSMTKKITIYLFIVLNILLIYSGAAMWYFADISYLGSLITDVIGQLIVFITYAAKSAKENTVGGITYDTAMKSYADVSEVLNETEEDESGEEETYDDNQIYG